MTKIFFKKIDIENYKCFESISIELNTPDGKTAGSGLNILIGENGTGKTSILEAVNFLTQSKYSSENRLSINDYFDYGESIKIIGQTDEFNCKSSIDFYKDFHFTSGGVSFEAKPRYRKEANKILSSPFIIKNHFWENSNYYDKGSKQKSKIEIDSRDLSFSNSRITDDSVDVFYFDKNRSRHLLSGTYKTTFDQICEDFNWRFIKNLPKDIDKIRKSITGEYFSNTLDLSRKGVGNNLADEMSKFFKNDLFKDLKIDLVDILQPFSNAALVIRPDDHLKQINTKNLGSGIEMIMVLLLLKALSLGEKNGSIIYLIDEPELHLHPKAQESLAKILLKESRVKQIIISTHSPYMFKELLPHSGVITLKNESNKILIQKEDGKSEKLLPWSPSWGEINFKAYNMPTIEFHNELYGYLFKKSRKDKIEDFEKFLVDEGVKQDKHWERMDRKGKANVTLHTYIRHSIHHPENKENDRYTIEKLKKSIEGMMSLLSKVKNQGGSQ